MTDTHLSFKEEAGQLARQFFGDDIKKCAGFVDRLIDICSSAQDKDFLLIHNPGGWGHTPLEHSLQWERSIVEGIRDVVEGLGYSWLLIQYIRTGYSRVDRIGDAKEQAAFFSNKAKVMAAELRLITRYLNALKVIMIGVSQGAAFGNAVMQELGVSGQVYSIELGMPFPYQSRRVINENTLAVDGNGLMPDALMEWNVITIVKTYVGAPYRWIKYRLQGKPRKFTWCINVPGHDYNWEYPEVQRQIGDFFEVNFGNKNNVEVDRK